jgi:lysozyme family protein
MKWNVPIITFLQRTWMLLVFAILSNWAVLSNHQFFRHWTIDMEGKTIYEGQTIFQMFGGVAYVPGLVSAVLFVTLLCIHLFFRETIDKDVNDGTYLRDWASLSPNDRVLYSTIIRIGFIIGFCILCSGLAKGAEPDQLARWNAAKINPKSSIALDMNISLYQKLMPRYQKISDMRKNGVPAPVLFCLHQRESSGSFLCHPHEGSPLTHRTRDVPKGRLPDVDPPYTFEQSAEDAYYVCDRLDRADWCHTASRLQAIESFNGLGYQKFHPDVPSPYLWSGTTIYTRGKYTGDGRFDRLAIDKQLGCAAILKRMEERGIVVFCGAP